MSPDPLDSRTPLYGHSLRIVRTPRNYEQFSLTLGKVLKFSLNSTALSTDTNTTVRTDGPQTLVSCPKVIFFEIQSNLAISNSVNSKSPLFEGRSNALGFTLPLYASPVISKPRYFELFFISLRTSK